MSKFEELPPATGREWLQATPLDPELRRSLARVIPSLAGGHTPQYPTRLTFEDGSVQDHVLLVDAFVAYAVGSWRGDVARFVDLEVDGLVAIEEATDRLPANMANEIYAAATESAMGGFEFVLRFRQRPPLVARVGNYVDLLMLPRGYSFEDLESVDFALGPSVAQLEVITTPPIKVAAFR